MAYTTIIAEAGVNHCGDLDLAFKLVDVAKETGADIVKFQTFKASKLASPEAKQAAYQSRNMGKSQSQYEMLKALELSEDDFLKIKSHCQKQDIEFLSTPFDVDSLDFLVKELKVRRLKVGSGDMTTAPLLYEIARTKLPVIMSTGMAEMFEIELAMAVLYCGYHGIEPNYQKIKHIAENDLCKDMLAQYVSLLHCTTEYPAPLNTINLAAMDVLSERFGGHVGFSDHSEGIEASIYAVARGAQIIEKHMTLDHDLPGPDHKASLMPKEFKQMVDKIRETEIILGDGIKTPSETEIATREVARKSILTAEKIDAGTCLNSENITFKRPGNGISPFKYWDIIGKETAKNLEKDYLIQFDDLCGYEYHD